LGQETNTSLEKQVHSGGISSREIVAAALEASAPEENLAWLDIGCGTGDVLREVRDRFRPAQLLGIDVLPWLDDDLRSDVTYHVARAEDALSLVEPVDRVLLVETLEHLESPWTVLRQAAKLVAPGGKLVVTTPNVSSLRNRLSLLLRGELTTFRSDNEAHLTPALPHTIEAVMVEEGLTVSQTYAHPDGLPKLTTRQWPRALVHRWPRLLHLSIVCIGARPPRSA
jgi:2-polyprenyl-3-methyl-5-hydroxy-6-metoxy-1,4-benzoquinol methylase